MRPERPRRCGHLLGDRTARCRLSSASCGSRRNLHQGERERLPGLGHECPSLRPNGLRGTIIYRARQIRRQSRAAGWVDLGWAVRLASGPKELRTNKNHFFL